MKHDPKALPRLRIAYTTRAGTHHMTVHYATGTDANLAATNGQALANQLKTLMASDQSFTGADFIPPGTNVANPVTWTVVAGTATPPAVDRRRALELSFVGRTVGGCRSRLFFFVETLDNDANYRLTTSEQPLFAPIVTFLNSNAACPVAADGLAAVWKQYANISDNKYWVRKVRG